jgi:XTP/dITP diphosphohydrolase
MENPMRIILSTKNPSKALQIQTLLNDDTFEVVTLADIGIHDDVVEDGDTLEANALKKAQFAFEQTGEYVIAEDSGLYIDALDGRPGVYAARWAGEEASSEEIMNFTLKQLEGVPEEARTATFRTVAIVMTPNGKIEVCTGELAGRMLPTPRTVCQPKMPYSPLFQPLGHDKTWAEMTTEEENDISHRGKAFRQVREMLRRHIT